MRILTCKRINYLYPTAIKKSGTFLLLLLAFNGYSQTSNEIKVMYYNLLNYPETSNFSADTAERNPYYRTILAAADPDVLVVEEMNSQAGINSLLTKVLNQSGSVYTAGTFNDGPDTDNGIFFKTSKFSFISNIPIATALRNISEFKLKYLATGDTIRFYAVHLKASAGSSNELLRAAEIDSLRKRTNTLPAGSLFMVGGDFNIYGSTESCYQKMLQVTSGVEGHFIDPIVLSGSWNNSAYAIHHTQSPRIRTFGGGATGGMDDRFDLILYSKAIATGTKMNYVANSEIAYGNDGNHFNDSINKMPNTAVSAAVANALHNAADHIPVIARFTITNPVAASVDMGVTALLSPVSPTCANASQSVQVQIKNYSANTVNFASTSCQITLQATNPSAVLQNFTQIINTGTLAAGTSMSVSLGNYTMDIAGNYIFNAFTTISNDVNTTNNSMSAVNVQVAAFPSATVSPSGPISICNGSSTTLTASLGSSYLWSTGATTQSISVIATGSYMVTVSNNSGCSSTSGAVAVSIINPGSGSALFTETFGTTGGSTITIANYETNNAFDNDNLTMSGSADIRNTNVSSGYLGASGLANVFFTNTVGKNFIISGINSSNYSNLTLSFGLWRSATDNGAGMLVKVSTDGTNYTSLSIPTLTGSGWAYVTVGGNIPSTSNLRIQFIQNNTGTVQYRIDDLKLSGSLVSQITASGPTTFCTGDSVILTASSGTNYFWSNGVTTQSIKVTTSGNYTVSVDCITSAVTTVTVNNCNSIVFQLKVFIQGLYLGNGLMAPLYYDQGLSSSPTACDYINVELYDATDPSIRRLASGGTLSTNGVYNISLPASFSGNSYYVVVKHRNSIETWSKIPVLFGLSTSFDFTSNF